MTEVLVEGCKGCIRSTGARPPELYYDKNRVICATGRNARHHSPILHLTGKPGVVSCVHLDCPLRIGGTLLPDRAVRVMGS